MLNIFTDKRFLNGKSKIDDRKILKESSIYVIDNVFKNKFAHWSSIVKNHLWFWKLEGIFLIFLTFLSILSR